MTFDEAHGLHDVASCEIGHLAGPEGGGPARVLVHLLVLGCASAARQIQIEHVHAAERLELRSPDHVIAT